MKHAFSDEFIKTFFSGTFAFASLFGTFVGTTQAMAPDEATAEAVTALSEEETSEEENDEGRKKALETLQELAAQKEDILWLSRILYSETKIPSEQRFIAWVVRNRVELGYRGATYKEVALSPHQFSGLNSSDRHFARNISMHFGSTDPAWLTAVAIAEEVYKADQSERPFSQYVTHFYTPQAVAAPAWARGRQPVLSLGTRFAFYTM